MGQRMGTARQDQSQDQRKANNRTAAAVVTVVVGMVGLAFASVPLYRLFCQATGFGGTPSVAAVGAPGAVSDRIVTVRFDANVQPGIPWRFHPVQKEIRVRPGESALAYYEAENLADVPVVGQATFNVTPHKAGAHFVKIDCFCFTEQTLKAGEKVPMPVSFYVDPSILDDRNADDIDTITLSYTFFRALDEAQRLQAGAIGESRPAPVDEKGRAPSRPNG